MILTTRITTHPASVTYVMLGGLFWCDFRQEFEPVPGLTQVFGHTASGGDTIRRVADSYCIDCLDRSKEFLELELE